jgi:UDP-N-acetylmuramoyl-tripeptide--D-alanyl-D-alanine ligase
MNIAELYSIFLQSKGVNTDTRSITSGQLFFALKGANFNGNTYAIRAIEQGALYAIVDEITEPHTNIIQVADVLETLQALAKYHREQFQIPVLALTGSNGKTTTKELIHAVLSSKYKVIATIGNLNNHIGVPLTLLRIQADTEIAIIEMGANHQKEIASYCTYTLPTHGLITNIGKAHLEGFGGEEGVLKGKTELFDYLNANQKEIFIYTGDDKLMSIATQLHQVKFYGKTATNQELFVDATIDETADLVKVNYEGISIQTHLVGTYNFPNITDSEENIKVAFNKSNTSNL